MSRTPSPHGARPRHLHLSALAVSMVLLLAACGSDELGGTVVEDGLGCTITSVDRDTADVPTIEAGATVGDATEANDIGEADEAACIADPDRYLTVDLMGATVSDGTVFNSTYEDDQPLTLRLGQGQLIVGLETGLNGLAVGGRRQIIVPAAEAYGETGDEGLGIGPDEDLEFVVDLLAISESPQFCNPVTSIPEGSIEGKPTEVAVPSEPPTEVVTTVLTPGDGPEATASSYVEVHYLGVSCATGTQFDSSWDRGEPINVALSDAEPTAVALQVIEGWTEGMVGQAEGSRIQIDIPSDLAYGPAGQAPSILPNDPLTFIVDILRVSDEPPADPNATTTTTAAAGADGAEGADGDATTTTPEGDATTTTEAG
jgi:FKBP-type peptidyl-prolyl cis-trans isomerase